MEIRCEKIPFITHAEASAELMRIVESNDYRSWKRKSCCRVYTCPICSTENYIVYHLSSKPFITNYE